MLDFLWGEGAGNSWRWALTIPTTYLGDIFFVQGDGQPGWRAAGFG